MNLHGLAADEGDVTPEGCVMRSWCCCGFLFVAVAVTARKAKRVIRRKLRDHRGQAYAAGPGWRT